MDALQTLLLIIDIALWVLLVAVHAIRLPLPTQSQFELNRLAAGGDRQAEKDLRRIAVHARLLTLQTLIETKLIIIISVLTVFVFGWLLGLLVALVAIMQRDSLAQVTTLRKKALAWFSEREMKLIEKVEQWTWLDWFKGNYQPQHLPQFTSKAELEEAISQSPAILSTGERARLLAGLVFDGKIIQDIMTPKAMIDAARAEDIIGPLVLDELHKTGHSRFPVIEGDIDHVVGILYLRSLVELLHKKQTVQQAMQPKVHYIHQDQDLEHALHGFLRTKRHLFIVVNDYRETVGVVSLEDVLEALIGKRIVDEFDRFDDLRAVAESNPRRNNEPQGKKDI